MFCLFLTMLLTVALVLAAGGEIAAQPDPGVAAAGAAPVAYGDTISQYGITWIFDQDYEYGQFANGDYWVVGPAHLVERRA